MQVRRRRHRHCKGAHASHSLYVIYPVENVARVRLSLSIRRRRSFGHTYTTICYVFHGGAWTLKVLARAHPLCPRASDLNDERHCPSSGFNRTPGPILCGQYAVVIKTVHCVGQRKSSPPLIEGRRGALPLSAGRLISACRTHGVDCHVPPPIPYALKAH